MNPLTLKLLLPLLLLVPLAPTSPHVLSGDNPAGPQPAPTTSSPGSGAPAGSLNQESEPPPPQPAPATVRIVGETKLPPYRIVRLKAENVPPKFGLRWRVKAQDTKNQPLIDWASGDRVQKPEWVAPPGTYTVELTVGGTDKEGQFVLDGDEVIVTIGTPTPAPTPNPVIPPPGPGPPPAPQPSAAPIQKPGLRVLIVRESDANAQNALTAGQREIIRPGAVWDYLRSRTVTEAENPNGAWRILDPHVNPLVNGDPDGKTWAAALGRPRTTIPWMVISNGTRNVGYEGPLPADITGQKFIDLLKQYE